MKDEMVAGGKNMAATSDPSGFILISSIAFLNVHSFDCSRKYASFAVYDPSKTPDLNFSSIWFQILSTFSVEVSFENPALLS